ncbi:MAG: NAD-dependent epimerase/dehydratase family protein [candidate division NC10 bacterium]
MSEPTLLRIGITGVVGMIGTHLRAFLQSRSIPVVPCPDEYFQDPPRLDQFVSSCDAIVHLAGMNRGQEDEILETNIRLTQALTDACDRTHTRPHILFADSIRKARGDAYGQSKTQCAEMLQAWANRTGALFTDLVLPNVFGEGTRPFYNSVVATFCHQIANEQEPTILVDAEMELLHAQDVALIIYDAIHAPSSKEVRPQGTRLCVSDLLERLREMNRSYRAHVFPRLENDFALALFNSYRSYLYPAHYPVRIPQHQDPRGVLVETVKSQNGGQCFVSWTHPGVTRGNHYHLRRLERFLVLQGQGLLKIRKCFSDEIRDFALDGSTPAYVDIPTLHAHSITNIGLEPLVTFFWSHQLLDPAHPDQFLEKV